MKTRTKGFTLIELLIVIAILAVLSVAVVLVLNPAEIIKQGRDSTRISDLSALNSAIALYLADVTPPSLGTCSATLPRCTANGTSPFLTRTGACTVTSSTVVTGGGWVDVVFGNISSGSPLSREPLDPVNNTTNFYAYGCSNGSPPYYELDANMESGKFANGGSSNVESTDGGDNPNWYEIGNSLTM